MTGECYHLINRGSDSRIIFTQSRDYERFLKILRYYQYSGPKPSFSKFSAQDFLLWEPKPDAKLVDIVCYCLMPNHYHIVAKQLKDNGISIFMSQLQNSYTKRFNTKYRRVGPLLQGAFKAVLVDSDEQLLHVARYVHINPVVARLAKDLSDYKWSSYEEYMNLRSGFCTKNQVLDFFKSEQEYDVFLRDQITYGQSLEILKHYHLSDEVYDATFEVAG